MNENTQPIFFLENIFGWHEAINNERCSFISHMYV